ncbi:MAG: CPBP family intramembrane metalloprotease [Oscillospiraceae bacterium]|nr:CPBP family intramembrane metalloprotease [Oscillospiraceae bacterium]
MAVPVIFVFISHVKPAELGFTKDNLPAQILVGIGVGVTMSLTLTLVPTLLGFGDWVSSGKNYTEWWQFAYEFIYCIGAVGVTEEFIFRGYFVHKLRQIKDSSLFAGIVSSVMFGLFHIFGGNAVQVIFTSVIGGILYVCREKVKHCTLLSLIIAHGVYDALICVWSFVF